MARGILGLEVLACAVEGAASPGAGDERVHDAARLLPLRGQARAPRSRSRDICINTRVGSSCARGDKGGGALTISGPVPVAWASGLSSVSNWLGVQ